ncbi:helix-turn-helix domain-containing protein [Novisyntrophococcus fermenticellae]|nr:helix-turn-helix transcriptional regulator [Novisyntrophococcus fermenticellae]
MKLAEKIQYLRKEHCFTQEQLAEQCNVSRQAITKWESDIAIPETEKIIF